MRFGTFRPLSVLLPFSLIAAIPVAGTEFITGLFICYTLLLIFSLDAPGCFRNASFTEPGTRRIDARFLGSLIQTAVGSLLMYLAVRFIPLFSGISISAVCCVPLLMIEQLFEERLFSNGRNSDAVLLAVISSILYCGSIMLGYPLPGFAIAFVIALIVTFVNLPIRFRKLLMNVTFTPRALLQDVLLPIILAAMSFLTHYSMISLLIAWGIGRVCRTFARCSEDESRKPRLFVSAVVLIASIAACLLPGSLDVIPICVAAVLTYLIGFSMEYRTPVGALLFAACGILYYQNLPLYAVCAAFVACIIVFDRRVLFRKA